MTDNGQDIDYSESKVSKKDLWYSSYGYIEANKYHARLTWNPYFNELIESINKLMSKTNKKN